MQRWTPWSWSGRRAFSPPPRTAAGVTTRSTSSTRQATSTSRWRCARVCDPWTAFQVGIYDTHFKYTDMWEHGQARVRVLWSVLCVRVCAAFSPLRRTHSHGLGLFRSLRSTSAGYGGDGGGIGGGGGGAPYINYGGNTGYGRGLACGLAPGLHLEADRDSSRYGDNSGTGRGDDGVLVTLVRA